VIIDSQVHLWQRSTEEHPWPEGQPAWPLDMPEHLPAPMISLMDDAGVDRAVVVPPIWAGDENSIQLGWCADYPGRFGVMGRFDLWSGDREALESWLEQPGMLGIRLSYGLETGWLEPGAAPWFWAAAQRLGIPLMILVQGGQRPMLTRIAERYPGLTFIVDHLGLFTDDPRLRDPFEDFSETLALARLPNIYAKASALPAYSVEDYPYPRLHDYVRQAFDAFGPQRLMWGSDVTRLTRITYRECLDHVARTLGFLSVEDKEWILGKTAAEVLNWPVDASS
jgi:predicted TIM-barrel fold metal-dependent hydrolase